MFYQYVLYTFFRFLVKSGFNNNLIPTFSWCRSGGWWNILTIAHPVKGHLAGEYEISGRLLAMLSMLPKTDKRVFPTNYSNLLNSFTRMRKRVAAKLQRPEIAEISFKSYRHWGGTTIAEATNGNVLIVKRMLRHKCITSSMKYIHAIKFEAKEFEETTATTVDEIRNLGKTGWQKYDEIMANGVQVHFYRRPKRFTWVIWEMLWFTMEMLSVILINQHNIKLVSPQAWAGSSARLERSTDNRKVGSSNPPRPTIFPLIFADSINTFSNS